MANKLISLIIPVYNERDNIEPLLNRLEKIINEKEYEVVFINDGSTDGTDEKIKLFTKENKHVKLISFNRNFGHQMALMCGYHAAKGDAVISLDADLQDPPEIIPEMVEKWKNGAKIVYAKRSNRDNDNFFKKITAYYFYKFINFLSDTEIPQEVGDFRLLDREVVDFLINLPEQSRFLRGLVAWAGYPVEYVLFKREKRHTGKTHYPLAKMVNLAIDGIISFSTRPLRIASVAGFITATLGFVGIIYAVFGKFFLSAYWVTGWTLLFVGIMFIGGVQLICIGIIGEYLSKMYQEIQRRPQFVIREKVNV